MDLFTQKKYVLYSAVLLVLWVINSIMNVTFVDSQGFIVAQKEIRVIIPVIGLLFYIAAVIWAVATIVIVCKEMKACMAKKAKANAEKKEVKVTKKKAKRK